MTQNLSSQILNTQPKCDSVSSAAHAQSAPSAKVDEIVSELVSAGLPKVFSPNNFLNKIASNYDISLETARECLKLAIKELEAKSETKTTSNPVTSQALSDLQSDEDTTVADEQPASVSSFQSCGYFYPTAKSSVLQTKDSMDNLNSFGLYNRTMFNIA